MKISKPGVTLAAIYVLITIAIWIYTETCNTFLCDLYIVIPLAPWPILVEDIDAITKLYDNAIYRNLITFVMMAINTFFVYGVGWLISLFRNNQLIPAKRRKKLLALPILYKFIKVITISILLILTIFALQLLLIQFREYYNLPESIYSILIPLFFISLPLVFLLYNSICY